MGRAPPGIPGYQLLAPIGEGGSGEVWLARNAVGTLRAVKVVRRARFGDDKSFQREFDGVQRYEPISLTHEGLIPILQAGHDAETGDFFYIMELGDPADTERPAGKAGYRPRTLASELGQRGRLPLADCLDLALKLAAALAHLHSRRLVHRDLKPANILFVAGRPKLADVGLVTASNSSRSIVGTPGYIAPEGPGRVRADVFALGKVFYEMLEGRDCAEYPAATTDTVVAPEAARRAEFWRVIERACDKDERKRQESAIALRDEVLLVLGGRALGPWRAFGWLRANLFQLLALFVFLAGCGAWVFWEEKKASRERERERQRQGILQQLSFDRVGGGRVAGWSRTRWERVVAAARLRADAPLRDEAAAALAGLDARVVQSAAVDGAWVALDRAGRRLLVDVPEGVEIWDGVARHRAAHGGDGPVAFGADESAVQFIASGGRFAIRDLEKPDTVRELNLTSGTTIPVDPRRPVLQTLTADGAFAAAAVPSTDGLAEIAVWRVASGELLRSFRARASALALAPDGSLVCLGDAEGKITVYSLGDDMVLATLLDDRTAIESLALHRDPRVAAVTGARGWLLAAGDAGGTIRLWDLAKGHPRLRLFGSEYQVLALAFSPDGATLASAGRAQGRLWDTATGRLLLNLATGDHVHQLVFSADGKRLASCSTKLFSEGKICVWELDDQRGTQNLRGLSAHVSKVEFSPDGTALAALAHNWQIGVWDRASGALRAVLDGPTGFTADNAGLAFTADGTALGCVSGREAKVWDTATWRERAAVPLDDGIADALVARGSDRLLAFRLENLTGPRVCRIRDLLSATPADPIAEIVEFDRHVFGSAAAPDGSVFVAEGLSHRPEMPRAIAAFDALTGALKWRRRLTTSFNFGVVLIDPRSTVVCARLTEDFCQLIALADDATLPGIAWPPGTGALGPRGEWRAVPEKPGSNPRGWSLLHRDNATPQVTLGIEALHSSGFAQFDASGDYFAWGNEDGTVSLCDLQELARRLREAGLGWAR